MLFEPESNIEILLDATFQALVEELMEEHKGLPEKEFKKKYLEIMEDTRIKDIKSKYNMVAASRYL